MTEPLQAGRELDRLVASRVMGWRQWVYEYNGSRSKAFWRPGNWDAATEFDLAVTSVVPATEGDDGTYYANSVVPDYSTDISDAWVILDRLDREISSDGHKRYWVEVGNDVGFEIGDCWYCKIEDADRKDPDKPWDEQEPTVWELATTAPLAICAAALKLMELPEHETTPNP